MKQAALFPKAPAVAQGFEEAWKIYPKRHVSENKRDALKQWIARRREGVPETEMLEGIQRYRNYCEKKRIAGTEFVMQPRRFLGLSRHFEQDWRLNGHAVVAREELSRKTLSRLHQNEREALPPEEAAVMLQQIRTGLRKQ